MSISKKSPLVVTDTNIPTLNRVLTKLYDDVNEVVNSVNQSETVLENIFASGKEGDIRVIQHDKDKYFIEVRAKDGWVSTKYIIEEISGFYDGDTTYLTDSTGGTASDTIAASGGSWSNSEINNAVATLSAKINTNAQQMRKILDKLTDSGLDLRKE